MKKFAIILLLLFSSVLFANDFRFYVDHASYYDNEKAFVELYFMLPRFAMARQGLANGDSQAKFLLAVNITQDEKKVYAKTLTIDDYLESGDTLRSNDFIPEIVSLHLLPGTYTMNTTVKDMYSGRISVRESDIEIGNYDMSALTISDIQIASYVGHTQTKNKFTKLGAYDVIPQANPEFDKYTGNFYSYFEVYKLSKGDKYSFISSLRDLNNEVIIENPVLEREAPGVYDVLIDYMDIHDIPSGIYNYQVWIKNESNGEIAEKRKHIYMIQEEEIDLLMYDEYAVFQNAQLDSIFTVLKPLMTQMEIKNYRSANLEGKRHLFIEFWKKRDTNLNTNINEYYLEIMDRVRYAKENFTYLNKGASSDRGQVLLKYGYPSEIQRSDAGGYSKDHEIWLYEGLRGDIQFVFCDTKGRGYFELIHSNMEGEIYNARWKDVIKAGAKSY
jgi:GWxTD domain-containing protein